MYTNIMAYWNIQILEAKLFFSKVLFHILLKMFTSSVRKEKQKTNQNLYILFFFLVGGDEKPNLQSHTLFYVEN